MDPNNQEDTAREEWPGFGGHAAAGPEPAAPPDPIAATPVVSPPGETSATAASRVGPGLAVWLLMLLVFGVGGLFFHLWELAAMTALAGLFVLSQAADLDPQWRHLHYSVTWVVPACGLMIAVPIAFQLLVPSDTPAPIQALMLASLIVAAAVCLLSAPRPFANLAARALFRTDQPSHTLRLATRLALAMLVLALPGWLALRWVFNDVLEQSTALISGPSLEAQLIGYVLLALASVGFLIRRTPRESLERLGLRVPTLKQLAWAALGVAALYGINAGADWLQQSFFRDQWEADHHVNEMIATGIGGGKAALLGLSAGIGEEITLRGALQPKLGLVMTSLLFASLHVQYSWFGIAVIFVLGLILGMIRIRTNTAVAMAVHGAYDVLAVLSV